MSRLSSLGFLAEVERRAGELAIAKPADAFLVGIRLALVAIQELPSEDLDGDTLSAVLALATAINERVGGAVVPDA